MHGVKGPLTHLPTHSYLTICLFSFIVQAVIAMIFSLLEYTETRRGVGQACRQFAIISRTRLATGPWQIVTEDGLKRIHSMMMLQRGSKPSLPPLRPRKATVGIIPHENENGDSKRSSSVRTIEPAPPSATSSVAMDHAATTGINVVLQNVSSLCIFIQPYKYDAYDRIGVVCLLCHCKIILHPSFHYRFSFFFSFFSFFLFRVDI